jgi:hypothetical protein
LKESDSHNKTFDQLVNSVETEELQLDDSMLGENSFEKKKIDVKKIESNFHFYYPNFRKKRKKSAKKKYCKRAAISS